MTTSTKPRQGWIADLPRERMLGEYSLWSADLANLERDIRRTEPHTDLYHVDVADGRFAPSFLFFPRSGGADPRSDREAAAPPSHG